MTTSTLSAKKLLVAGIALSAALGLGACSSGDASASDSSSSDRLVARHDPGRAPRTIDRSAPTSPRPAGPPRPPGRRWRRRRHVPSRTRSRARRRAPAGPGRRAAPYREDRARRGPVPCCSSGPGTGRAVQRDRRRYRCFRRRAGSSPSHPHPARGRRSSGTAPSRRRCARVAPRRGRCRCPPPPGPDGRVRRPAGPARTRGRAPFRGHGRGAPHRWRRRRRTTVVAPPRASGAGHPRTGRTSAGVRRACSWRAGRPRRGPSAPARSRSSSDRAPRLVAASDGTAVRDHVRRSLLVVRSVRPAARLHPVRPVARGLLGAGHAREARPAILHAVLAASAR